MKRITNSERKRRLKKKKLKNRRKSNKAAIISASPKPSLKRTNLLFTHLLAGITFFIFFSPFSAAPSPDANGIEGEKEVALASTFDSDPQDADSTEDGRISAAEAEQKRAEKLKREVLLIIKGTPMEAMTDEIAKRDRATAAYIVGIALKESEFGFHAPRKSNNVDCYNYWGYRGRENPTRSGYSCFDSPAQAISVVGNRIDSLIKQGVKNPAGMVVWKCGYSCRGFDKASVKKWINDVGINYYKLNPADGLAKKD
ncbi:MAG: hypothetical protein WCW77_04150 [Patescibacteria group bacterium]|jgi:hypothetical protein